MWKYNHSINFAQKMVDTKGVYSFMGFQIDDFKRVFKDLQQIENGCQYYGFWYQK